MIGRTNSSMGGGKIKSLNKSCVVWLPLNGNTNNYGKSDLTFSPYGVGTYSVVGGNIYPGCYYSVTHGATGSLISNKAITLGNQQSMFCWVKFEHLCADSSLGGSCISQHRHTTCTGMGITFKYVSTTTGYLSISEGTGSSRTFNTYTGKSLLSAGVWYHVGFTYDGTTVTLYVNGAIDGTYNIPNRSNPGDYLMIHGWAFSGTSGASIENNYVLQGCTQDIRIYDKTLTLKEVQTIYNWRPISYVRTKQVRYLRDTTSGSSANTGNHWCEIQVFDENGVNVARGINATNASSGANVGTIATDGNISYTSYSDLGSGTQTIQIDLGAIKNISYIIIYHYYGDNRNYAGNITQVSANGTTWDTMFNSNLQGRYIETSTGHAIIMVPGP